ncbi:MAG: site-2 protease family protein [Clostridia bacterium]|nr:site-2 protease family protein [Clostridia bacterium]
MLTQLFRYGFDKDILIQVLLSIPVIIFSLSIHECAHAVAANALGDRTARNMGRMTLNPLKHLDPVGTLLMLICGFGWAKPVPINARNFRYGKLSPKWGMAVSALAGPFSNLLLGFISYQIFYLSCLQYFETNSDFWLIVYMLFLVFATLNTYLAIFNLLPIPPLDGSRILFTFLPARYYFEIMKYERYISIIVMVLLVSGGLSRPLSAVSGGLIKLYDMFASAVYGKGISLARFII